MAITSHQLPRDPRLGRHVRHDSRSSGYALLELPSNSILTQQWQRRCPVLDQGQVGSCTGNAAVGWLGTDCGVRQGLTRLANGALLDEALALSIYSDAETIDGDGPYPPNDNGSSGLSVAKVLKARGLSGKYLHAFTVAAALSALQSGPGMAGIEWYNSMFDPKPDGQLVFDLKSGLAGGHEFTVDGCDVTAAGIVERIWMTNSWSTSWGLNGRGYFSLATFTSLLGRQGDYTVPSPTPTPTPTPIPTPSGDSLAFLDPMVAARIRAVAGTDIPGWMNQHFEHYFKIKATRDDNRSWLCRHLLRRSG